MIILLSLSICISIVTGAFFWLYSKEIVWWEWCLAPVIATLAATILYFSFTSLICGDTQTLSGFVVSARYQPYWVEESTSTDSKGRKTTSHTTHYPSWFMTYSTGHIEEVEIKPNDYVDLYNKFGRKRHAVLGSRPSFDHGDRFDYIVNNETNYIQPVVVPKKYINRLKHSTSLFTYKEEKQTIPYPNVTNYFISNRLLGSAKSQFNQLDFDRMNARLGPMKKVNIIFVGFASSDNTLGHQIETQWQGGKKNDLVICYGKNWAYCFGWTEHDIVKRNLESLFLVPTINNTMLSRIESEVRTNYILKDWNKFNYVDINFPLWTYIVCIIIMVLIQVVYFIFALNNNSRKTRKGFNEYRYRR